MTKRYFSPFDSSIVIYPLFFNAMSSVEQGRKVHMKYALRTIPTAQQIANAASQLGYSSVTIQPDKRHPRCPTIKGRVLVEEVEDSKSRRQLLVDLASLLKSKATEPTQPVHRPQSMSIPASATGPMLSIKKKAKRKDKK